MQTFSILTEQTITIPEFADSEVPVISPDGSTATFLNAPNPPASLNLFLNGARQLTPNNFTLAGAIVTFVVNVKPDTDQVVGNYRY